MDSKWTANTHGPRTDEERIMNGPFRFIKRPVPFRFIKRQREGVFGTYCSQITWFAVLRHSQITWFNVLIHSQITWFNVLRHSKTDSQDSNESNGSQFSNENSTAVGGT